MGYRITLAIDRCTSSDTHGQTVGQGKVSNGRNKVARRKVKNGHFFSTRLRRSLAPTICPWVSKNDRCTAVTFRSLAASWWKIHSHVVEFLSAVFARFHVRYTLSIIVRRCLKSPRFVPYLHIGETWFLSLPDLKSPPQRRNGAKYFRQRSWFGEKSVTQKTHLSSEVNKYTAELSFGSSRNTSSRRAH